jgi:hypothetical protein
MAESRQLDTNTLYRENNKYTDFFQGILYSGAESLQHIWQICIGDGAWGRDFPLNIKNGAT